MAMQKVFIRSVAYGLIPFVKVLQDNSVMQLVDRFVWGI